MLDPSQQEIAILALKTISYGCWFGKRQRLTEGKPSTVKRNIPRDALVQIAREACNRLNVGWNDMRPVEYEVFRRRPNYAAA